MLKVSRFIPPCTVLMVLAMIVPMAGTSQDVLLPVEANYQPAHPDPTSGDFVLFGGDLGDGNYAGGTIMLRTGQHHIPGRHFVSGDGWWTIACGDIGCNLFETSLQVEDRPHPEYDGPDSPGQMLTWTPLPFGLDTDRQPADPTTTHEYRLRQADDGTLLALFKPKPGRTSITLAERHLETWWYAAKQVESLRHPYAHAVKPPTEQTFLLGESGELKISLRNEAADGSLRLWAEHDGRSQDLGVIELHLTEAASVSINDLVQWIGDLDGDSKPDLLMNHTYYYWDTKLWLSGAAKEGELVSEVARFFFSPPDSPGC